MDAFGIVFCHEQSLDLEYELPSSINRSSESF